MTNEQSNNELFSKMMQKSKLEMPYSDFDDRLMQRIEREASLKKTYLNNVNLSLVFFILGTGCGLVLLSSLSKIGTAIFGNDGYTVVLVAQVLFVVLVLTQLQNIIKLFTAAKRS
jgi:hypothetical protein